MKTTSEFRQSKKQKQRRKLCLYVVSFIPFVAMLTLTYVDSNSLSVKLDRCLRVAADVERRDPGFYGRWVEKRSGLNQTCSFLKKYQCCQNQRDLTFVFKDEQLNKVSGNSLLSSNCSQTFLQFSSITFNYFGKLSISYVSALWRLGFVLVISANFRSFLSVWCSYQSYTSSYLPTYASVIKVCN